MTIGIIAGILLLFVVISYQLYSRYKLKQEALFKEAMLQQQQLRAKVL